MRTRVPLRRRSKCQSGDVPSAPIGSRLVIVVDPMRERGESFDHLNARLFYIFTIQQDLFFFIYFVITDILSVWNLVNILKTLTSFARYTEADLQKQILGKVTVKVIISLIV